MSTRILLLAFMALLATTVRADMGGSAYLLGGTDGTLIGNVSDALKTSATVTSSVLPTGAATAANQSTEITSLASIDTTLTGLSKAEDAVHASGDKGVMALGVRKDLGGSLVSADGDYAPYQLTASGAIQVAVTDRPSQSRGRTHVDANIENQALDATGSIIYTVGSGKTFYLTAMTISGLNTATGTARLVIRNGSSTNKIPLLIPDRLLGGTGQVQLAAIVFQEPIPFTTDVRAVELSGDITASIMVSGYEEPN